MDEHPVLERCQPNHEQRRDGDESTLAERACHRPRFHAARGVDLQRNHEQHARRHATESTALHRCRRDTTKGHPDEPGNPEHRQRRPDEEAVLG